ncbi:MAG: DUF2304 family protein [Nanoarchaeota archaeon]|nr:DUF2304 family protein [Nanoarchaeota archaeon]
MFQTTSTLVFQILAILFAVFALSRVFLRFRDGEVSVKELAFWIIIWIGVIFVAVVPSITFTISNALGIERGVDLVIYVSIIVLFYLIFRVLVKLEMLEQEITKVVRKDAIEKGGKKKKQ